MGTETCQCNFCPDKSRSERNLSNRRIIINNKSIINDISFIYHNNIYKIDQTNKRDHNNFRETINSNFILRTIYMKNCAKKIINQYRQYKNMKKIRNDFTSNNNKICINNIRVKKIVEHPFSTRDNSKKDFKNDNKISSDENNNIYYNLNNKQKNIDRKSYDIYLNQFCKKINDSDLNSDNNRETLKEY